MRKLPVFQSPIKIALLALLAWVVVGAVAAAIAAAVAASDGGAGEAVAIGVGGLSAWL